MSATDCFGDSLRRAATRACEAVWREVYGTEFWNACPDPDRWIREELDALVPAVQVLREEGWIREGNKQ